MVLRRGPCDICARLLLLALAVCGAAGGAGKGARVDYVGGTSPELEARASGLLITTDAEFLIFQTRKRAVRVPFERIDLLEYGQKVDRRYALGVIVSPLLMLSKKRRHFLTIGYTDAENRRQALVFQVHKDDVRSVLSALEAKTGRRVEYQDDEARKAGGG